MKAFQFLLLPLLALCCSNVALASRHPDASSSRRRGLRRRRLEMMSVTAGDSRENSAASGSMMESKSKSKREGSSRSTTSSTAAPTMDATVDATMEESMDGSKGSRSGSMMSKSSKGSGSGSMMSSKSKNGSMSSKSMMSKSKSNNSRSSATIAPTTDGSVVDDPPMSETTAPTGNGMMTLVIEDEDEGNFTEENDESNDTGLTNNGIDIDIDIDAEVSGDEDPNEDTNEAKDPNAILTQGDNNEAENDATTKIFTIDSELDFEFFEGKGGETPTQEEKAGLVEQTKNFFSDMLSSTDTGLGLEEYRDFDMIGIDTKYDDESTPVKFSVTFVAEVELALSTSQTARTVATLMSGANFQDYIGLYVWQGKPWERNEFHDTHTVHFSTSGRGARRQ